MQALIPPAAADVQRDVQRALAEYGYGQLRPTGVLDRETKVAIERFERERKLPVTGAANERVVRELATVTGRQVD